MFDVAARIKALCLIHKIDSIYELAKITNIRQSTLQNIVSGNIKSPKSDTIEKICIGLGITLADFFTEESSTALVQSSDAVSSVDLTLARKIKNLAPDKREIVETVIKIDEASKSEQSATMGK